MILADLGQSGKRLLGRVPRDVLVVFVLIIASLASFGLGYVAGKEGREGTPFTTSPAPLQAAAAAALAGPVAEPSGQVVASKNGTKYYLPTCASASRISEANKVWFASIGAAQAAGYTAAANCPGL